MKKVNGCRAVLTNVTCDNPRVNIAMLTALGAKLAGEDPEPFLDMKNILGKKILAFLDPPHLIKLTRNTLGDYGYLVDGNGNLIRWNFILNLNKLQKEQGLVLANKLKQEHVEYSKNKMKVRLATQVFSQSVATALTVCSEGLKHPDFVGVEPTVKCLKIFDVLFDLMNSKYTYKTNKKAPLSVDNEAEWRADLDQSKIYINGLKHETGESVLKGRRKAAFVGWLADIKGIIFMYDEYVKPGLTEYLLTFRMSQDPLELFFGSIRAGLGHNNNPTVLQFKGVYKQLVAGALLKPGSGTNCLWDEISMLEAEDGQGSSISQQTDEPMNIEISEEHLRYEHSSL